MKTEDCSCDIKSEHLPLACLVVKSRSGDVASCNDMTCNADGVMAHTSESIQGIPRLSTYPSDTNNHLSYGIVVEKSETQPTETNHVFQEENIAVFIKSEGRAETQGTSNMETEDCACDIKSEHLPLTSLVVKSRSGDVASCNDIACNADGAMAHTSESIQGIPRLSTYHSDTNNHGSYGIVAEQSETQPTETNHVFQEENIAVFIKSDRTAETQGTSTMETEKCACDIKSKHLPLPCMVGKNRSGDVASFNDIACNAEGVMAHTSEITQGIPRLSTSHSDTNNIGSYGIVVEKSETQQSDINHVFYEENIAVFIKSERSPETQGDITFSKPFSIRNADHCSIEPPTHDFVKQECVEDDKRILLAHYANEQGNNNSMPDCCEDTYPPAVTYPTDDQIRTWTLNQTSNSCKSDWNVQHDNKAKLSEVNCTDPFKTEATKPSKDKENGSATWGNWKGDNVAEMKTELPGGEWRDKNDIDEGFVERDARNVLSSLLNQQVYDPKTDKVSSTATVNNPASGVVNHVYVPNTDHVSSTPRANHPVGSLVSDQVNAALADHVSAVRDIQPEVSAGLYIWEVRGVKAIDDCLRNSAFQPVVLLEKLTSMDSSLYNVRMSPTSGLQTELCRAGRDKISINKTPVYVKRKGKYAKKYSCALCTKVFEQLSTLHEHYKNVHSKRMGYARNICHKTFAHLSNLRSHKGAHTGGKPYTCNICYKTFAQVSHLETHERAHTGEKPYKCNICYKTFAQEGDLRRHQRTHTGEKPYTCNICYRMFTREGNLRRHQLTHTGEKPYHCNICQKSFSRLAHLESHKRTHTGEKPYTCNICWKTFTLTRHKRTQTGEKPYTCDICHKTFTHMSTLRTHKRTHTGEKPYTCDICHKTFTHMSTLRTHTRTHTGEKPYTCNICHKSFNHESKLRTHQRTHSGEKPYTCNICYKTFNYESSFRIHKRIHSGEKPYTCNICQKSFSRLAHLKSHKRTHTGEKPYTCNICHNSFSRMSILTIHKRTHTGEKPYTCNICYKSFNRVDTLRTHTRAHTGEKPYTCNICYQAFSQISNLITHKRTHTGEKPYTCNICYKSFNRVDTLRTHTRAHTGEKPYTCNICYLAFSQISNLITHKRTHTGEKPYTCNICYKSFNRVDTLRTHTRAHTGEKPYTCNICYQAFSQISNLITHKRTHTGERLYTCNICHKSLSRFTTLRTHMRTHTGEKPYKCHICMKAFSQYDYLKTHLQKHTNQNPRKCNLCRQSLSRAADTEMHHCKVAEQKRHKCRTCSKTFLDESKLAIHECAHTGERPYVCDICNKRFNYIGNLRRHMRVHSVA